MLQHRLYLLLRYSWKPFEKFIHAGTAFKIFEERGDWNARATKYPRTAEFLWRTLHRGTCRPVQHGHKLLQHLARFKLQLPR